MKIGEHEVDFELNRIKVNEQWQTVEPRVMALLHCLADNKGTVVSKDKLINVVWSDMVVGDGAITRSIAELRKTLKDNARAPQYIETIAKKGYRLIAEVSQPAAQLTQNPPPASPETKPTVTEKVTKDVTKTVTPMAPVNHQPNRNILMLVSALFLLVTIWLFWPSATQSTVASVKPVTTLNGEERFPSVSYNGQFLAFSGRATPTANFDLFIKLIDGDQPVQLTQTDASEISPKWHPSRQQLAFIRSNSNNQPSCQIVLMTITSGVFYDVSEEVLLECQNPGFATLSWSATGKNLYYTDGHFPGNPYRVFSLNLATGQKTPLTNPSTANLGDYLMQASPINPQQLAYFTVTDWPKNQLHLLTLEGQTVKDDKIIADFDNILPQFAWAADGQSIYYPSGNDFNQLQRLTLSNGDITTLYTGERSIMELEDTGENGVYMAVARKTLNIYQSAFNDPNTQNNPAVTPIITSSRQDWRPSMSPDGSTMAFLSNRSGYIEIWLRDQQSQKETQLSHLENTLDAFDFNVHLLNWSPDGRQLVFDTKQGQIFTINTTGQHAGVLTAQTPADFYARNPSWGLDGKGLYMTSNQSGDWQIWQTEVTFVINKDTDKAIATPKMLTKAGGLTAQPSDNGQHLYLSKFHKPGLWQLNLKTLQETQIIDQLKVHSWYEWYASKNGIYFSQETATGEAISFYDFANQTIKPVWQHSQYRQIDFFHLDLVRRQLVFSLWQQRESDILAVMF